MATMSPSTPFRWYSFYSNYFIYLKTLGTKWKNGIYPNDINTFNEELESPSTSMIELTKNVEASHKEKIVILYQKNL